MTRRRIYLAFILALLLILAELAARLYLVSLPESIYVVYDAFSSDILKEQRALASTWDNRGFWLSLRDTYPVISAPHHVYMVGSSITQGHYVHSTQTIASFIQARLHSYQVVNYGAAGQVAVGVYRQAQTLPLQPGDIVLMESITMDAYSAYNIQTESAGRCASLALIQLLCQPHIDEAMNKGLAVETLFAVRQTRAYIQAHGARFLYVITPYFYSLPPLTARDKQIDSFTWPDARNIYQDAYLVIYAYLRQEPDTLDLSRALDADRAAGRDYYFDMWHFDASGNEIVARVIYAALFGPF